jgi:hypothetical protein
MIVKSLMAAALLFATLATAAENSFEVCTLDGPCALRVTDTKTGQDIWLVTEDGSRLSTIWGGDWYLTTEDDYQKVRAMIPESVRWITDAINPTTGQRMEANVAPKPSGGPLVTGSITVNTSISTSGGGCTDCHKGSNADIHKKKLNEGGK